MSNERNTMPHGIPIKPRHREQPIEPVRRWVKRTDPVALMKEFEFRSDDDKHEFIISLLGYEENRQHKATMVIRPSSVTLFLTTQDIDEITELDKEYAAYADVLFKDIVYSC